MRSLRVGLAVGALLTLVYLALNISLEQVQRVVPNPFGDLLRKTPSRDAPEGPPATIPPPQEASPPSTARPRRPGSLVLPFPRIPSVDGRSLAELARDPGVVETFAPFTDPSALNIKLRAPGFTELVWFRAPYTGPVGLQADGHFAAGYSFDEFVSIATIRLNDRRRWPMPRAPFEWETMRELFHLYHALVEEWDRTGAHRGWVRAGS